MCTGWLGARTNVNSYLSAAICVRSFRRFVPNFYNMAKSPPAVAHRFFAPNRPILPRAHSTNGMYKQRLI
jgi:hypothetical protein